MKKESVVPNLRKMLSDRKAPYIQALVRMVETQNKTTLTNWALNYSEKSILPLWLKVYPEDVRPQSAIKAARDWMSGTIKLPQARVMILACHAAAREAEGHPVAQAAARAIGHCASAIHVPGHCLGLALYGAVALAYDGIGTEAPWEQVEQRAAEECRLMLESLHKKTEKTC